MTVSLAVSRRRALVLGALFAAATLSCSRTEPVESTSSVLPAAPVAQSTVPSAATLRIATNTQATLDDVRIGAGNFRDDERADSDGRAIRGYTAGLWIYVRGDPAADRHIRVGTGSTFSASGCDFKVVDVTRSMVTLEYRRRL